MSAPALAVRGLVKRYGSFAAADGVDLAVERGQAFGLLGPNGSGKTTVLSCALGLFRRTSGSAEVLGVSSDEIWRLDGRLACVFDTPSLLPGHTVAQNLAYQRRLRGTHGANAAAGRGIDEARALELVGLAHIAGRRASGLSLGQKKRLSLAAALAGEPELIVLDEPLSGLDPMGVRDVLALLRELVARGITLVVSSHRLLEMQTLLTHLAVLHKGRVLHQGPLEALLGDDSTVHVRVDDEARARAVLSGIGNVTSAPNGGLYVRSKAGDAPRVAKLLVEAGVGLEALAPQRRDLQAAFEAVVDAELARRGETREAQHIDAPAKSKQITRRGGR
jgi:ABC-2 type transport system ATP-binding protein